MRVRSTKAKEAWCFINTNRKDHLPLIELVKFPFTVTAQHRATSPIDLCASHDLSNDSKILPTQRENRRHKLNEVSRRQLEAMVISANSFWTPPNPMLP